jgi:hypothetical protein
LKKPYQIEQQRAVQRFRRLRWPEAEGRHSVSMRPEELAMLVSGLDLKPTRQRNWYRKSA